MQTSLGEIAEKAATQKGHRFGNLYERLNEEFLFECWRDINKAAAYGVDQVSAREYELSSGSRERATEPNSSDGIISPKGEDECAPLGYRPSKIS